ncbi:hypothetical protein FB451DRAFT_1377713 [Mycena latifolia]|nr:hypothetical protein FB451DRAFT_1377713 [Mycena latifolia]
MSMITNLLWPWLMFSGTPHFLQAQLWSSLLLCCSNENFGTISPFLELWAGAAIVPMSPSCPNVGFVLNSVVNPQRSSHSPFLSGGWFKAHCLGHGKHHDTGNFPWVDLARRHRMHIAHEPRRETEQVGLASEISDPLQSGERTAGGSTPLGSIHEKLRVQQMYTGKADTDSPDAEKTERQSIHARAGGLTLEDVSSQTSAFSPHLILCTQEVTHLAGCEAGRGSLRGGQRLALVHCSGAEKGNGSAGAPPPPEAFSVLGRGILDNCAGGEETRYRPRRDRYRDGAGIRSGVESRRRAEKGRRQRAVCGVETAYGNRRRCGAAARPCEMPCTTLPGGMNASAAAPRRAEDARHTHPHCHRDSKRQGSCRARSVTRRVDGGAEELAGPSPCLTPCSNWTQRKRRWTQRRRRDERREGEGRGFGSGGAERLDERLGGEHFGGADAGQRRSSATSEEQFVAGAARRKQFATSTAPTNPNPGRISRWSAEEEAAHAPQDEMPLREGNEEDSEATARTIVPDNQAPGKRRISFTPPLREIMAHAACAARTHAMTLARLLETLSVHPMCDDLENVVCEVMNGVGPRKTRLGLVYE